MDPTARHMQADDSLVAARVRRNDAADARRPAGRPSDRQTMAQSALAARSAVANSRAASMAAALRAVRPPRPRMAPDIAAAAADNVAPAAADIEVAADKPRAAQRRAAAADWE